VLKQVDLVRAVVSHLPVTGVLCFVEADWPLIGGAFTTRGIHAVWPKRLRKLLTEAGAEERLRSRLSESRWLRNSSPRSRVRPTVEIPGGPVWLQVASAVSTRRNWLNVWKPTIDALNTLLGRTSSERDWHPRG